jgi:colanic acid/amylovoran biosynthesis glycosyltransferase
MKGFAYIIVNFHKNRIAILNSLNPLIFGKEALSLRILYQVIPFIGRGSYDIIHCHFGYLAVLGVNLKASRAFNGPVVTTFRGHDISKYVQDHGAHVYDTIFERGDLFLCVSEEIKETLIKLGLNTHKIIIHRSGVDISKSNFRTHNSRIGDKLEILTIARLVEKKGVEYGIRAVAKVLKKYQNIKYRIAGDGSLRTFLQKLIDELNICCNVQLIGWQSQDQIVKLLQESSLLLAPSVTSQTGDREGIPGVIMEAMAWGLPVISTNHSGIPEVIKDGENGLLVPERDIDALAEKLEYLIEHPERCDEISRSGRRFVEKYYDIDKLNDRLVEIYQGLLL